MTYTELYTLTSDSALRNRVTVACLVAAETIRGESAATPNHAARALWAGEVFANPTAEGTRMFPAVLAANVAFTVAQVQGASDAALQTAVNNAVNLFAV